MPIQPTPYPEFIDQLAYIQSAEVKETFVFMVAQAQNLPGHTARPHAHGYITRNLHYYDGNHRSQFAFNVTQNWLLFYLQNPAKTHPELSLSGLRLLFPEARETKSGELTFKIKTIAQAIVTLKVVFGLVSVNDAYSFPDEVDQRATLVEGAITCVTVNSFERNPRARAACIRHHGHRCAVCSFDFREAYGPLGEGFIHVHHLVELSAIRSEYQVDPVRDLRPVCPNCHAMLHRRSPPISIELLQKHLASSTNRTPVMAAE